MRRSRRNAVLLFAVVAGLLGAGTAAADSIFLSGVDVTTAFTANNTATNKGLLSFTNGGAAGDPGVVDSAGAPGLIPIGPSGATVFFDATLSGFNVNNTTVFDPATALANQANFVGRTLVPGNPATRTLTFEIRDSTQSTTLLAFQALVYEDEFTAGIGGPDPSTGSAGIAVSTVVTGPDDPAGDGAIGVGNLTVGPCGGLGACGNELILVGGTLAADYGGVGSIGYLNIRLVSPNPSIPKNFFGLNQGYWADDFDAGNGLQNAPTVWELAIVPIPEPGTFASVAVGLLTMASIRRRSSTRD